MDTARFLIEVQRKAGQPADVRDPLAVTRVFLGACSDGSEATVLRRLIRALVSGRGLFSRADIDALTNYGARLGAALIDAHLRGFYKDAEWRAAMLAVARRAG